MVVRARDAICVALVLPIAGAFRLNAPVLRLVGGAIPWRLVSILLPGSVGCPRPLKSTTV